MRADVTMIGEIVLVSISEKIEIEKLVELKRIIFQKYLNKKIVICLKDVGFVGSYGITQFFQILDEIKVKNLNLLKISGVSRDFSFLMDSLNFKFEKYPTLDLAIQSYLQGISAAA